MQKQRLTLAREIRGMSRSDLATATGISVVSIGYYERGELDPGTSALVKLCRALDVSADFLLGLTDDYHELLPRKEAPAPAAVDPDPDPPKYSDVTIHLPAFVPMARGIEPRPEMNITIAGHVILELAKRLKTDPGTAITVGPGGEAHG